MEVDQNIELAKDDAKVYAAFYQQAKERGLSEDHALELTREYVQAKEGTYRTVMGIDIHDDN